MEHTTETHAVTGGPRKLLRVEGLVLLTAAVVAYRVLGGGWGAFAAGFFLPDLGILLYLGGPRAGAVAYNTTHSTVGPALAGAWGLAAGRPTLVLVALVWAAHVGFDRALGYGLKYGAGFRRTHLGTVGAKGEAREAGPLPAPSA